MTLNTISLVSFDFAFTSILKEHQFIFIVALLTLAFSVILLSWKVMLTQLGFLAIFYIIEESTTNIIYLLFMILQVALGIWVLYRYKKALDYFNELVLEKTHQIPQKITSQGNSGDKIPFL